MIGKTIPPTLSDRLSSPLEPDVLPNMSEQRRGQTPSVFAEASRGRLIGYRTYSLFTICKIAIHG